MREIDFLPDWYPAVRRQRAMLRTQVCVSAVVVFAGLGMLLASYRQCDAAEAKLKSAREVAQQAVKEVHQLDEMLSLQKQLVTKQRIIGELGLPVEMGRVISELNQCLPTSVSFVDLDFKTQEKAIETTIADRAKQGATPTLSRRLELNIKGVAPTESDVTAFWSRLIQRPYFTDVRLVNSIERRSNDHRWRSFEISLAIALDWGNQ